MQYHASGYLAKELQYHQNSVKAYEKGMKELADAQKILEDAVIKINEIKSN